MKFLNKGLLGLGLILIGLALGLSLKAQSLGAEELVKEMDELMRGESSYSQMRMRIHNPDWSKPRELEMFAYEDKLQEKFFIRITAPARDRGTGFLKIGKNLWMFVPGTERVMKIPPSMMRESWMGSDFTNDDLVRESSLVKDYIPKIITTEAHPEGGTIYQLELVPKPESAIIWRKILVWVWDRGYLPLREQFFDEQNKPVNEIVFSQVKKMSGREIPTVWEMRSLTKPGHKTTLELLEIKFDLKIEPGIFTERNLKSRNW